MLESLLNIVFTSYFIPKLYWARFFNYSSCVGRKDDVTLSDRLAVPTQLDSHHKLDHYHKPVPWICKWLGVQTSSPYWVSLSVPWQLSVREALDYQRLTWCVLKNGQRTWSFHWDINVLSLSIDTFDSSVLLPPYLTPCSLCEWCANSRLASRMTNVGVLQARCDNGVTSSLIALQKTVWYFCLQMSGVLSMSDEKRKSQWLREEIR